MLGAGADAGQVTAVPLRQRGVAPALLTLHHLDRADDQAQRGAQLVAHRGQEPALEQISLFCQATAVLGRDARLYRLVVEVDVARDQLRSLERAADLPAQQLIGLFLVRIGLEQDEAQLILPEIERFHHQAVAPVGPQQPLGHQLPGRVARTAGFQHDPALPVIGDHQTGEAGRDVRIFVQRQIATGDAQLGQVPCQDFRHLGQVDRGAQHLADVAERPSLRLGLQQLIGLGALRGLPDHHAGLLPEAFRPGQARIQAGTGDQLAAQG